MLANVSLIFLFLIASLVVYGLVYRKNISDGLESQSPAVPFSLGALCACVCVCYLMSAVKSESM